MHDSVQGLFAPKVDEAAAARQSPSHLKVDTGLLGMRIYAVGHADESTGSTTCILSSYIGIGSSSFMSATR